MLVWTSGQLSRAPARDGVGPRIPSGVTDFVRQASYATFFAMPKIHDRKLARLSSKLAIPSSARAQVSCRRSSASIAKPCPGLDRTRAHAYRLGATRS